MQWNPNDYNGIRNIRVPAGHVWTPDTFVFNNADDGSTGFMQGVHVLINHNGSVFWPVPVKLKSSCKVDIAYFPFDDQVCQLRFGSWMYSNDSMDFYSSLDKLDITHYIDNSEWELRAVKFHRSTHHYACCSKPHPDLTFTLHIRRRTFYYIWNIIVPCIMLSVLTLLTFWLPPTSGEKISLGLSVFLAFSMFMLLIAEEVPATSESVPLIGVYLTTVMTMTSMSVIMAVMVINLYNRSSKARRAPSWLKKVILVWICRLLCMQHDIERLAQSIRLEDDEELKYRCNIHAGRMRRMSSVAPYQNRRQHRYREYAELMLQEAALRRSSAASNGTSHPPNNCDPYERKRRSNGDLSNGVNKFVAFSGMNSAYKVEEVDEEALVEEEEEEEEEVGVTVEEEEPIWQLRDSVKLQQQKKASSMNNQGATATESTASHDSDDQSSIILDPPTYSRAHCKKEAKYSTRKEMVVEWQTIATVVDRLLFWLFFLVTVATYVLVLMVTPHMKPSYAQDATPIERLSGHTNSAHTA